MQKPTLSALELALGHQFKQKSWLELSLNHKSCRAEQPNLESNERLEWLGDAVLSGVISHFLFQEYPNLNEGQLSQLRSNLICQTQLAEIGAKMGLAGQLKHCNVDVQPSMLAAAVEALIGAVALDSQPGTKIVSEVVLQLFTPLIRKQAQAEHWLDSKNRLQQWAHVHRQSLSYHIIKEEGADHQKTFSIAVHLDAELAAIGQGQSKKTAAQNAASAVLEKLKQQKLLG